MFDKIVKKFLWCSVEFLRSSLMFGKIIEKFLQRLVKLLRSFSNYWKNCFEFLTAAESKSVKLCETSRFRQRGQNPEIKRGAK